MEEKYKDIYGKIHGKAKKKNKTSNVMVFSLILLFVLFFSYAKFRTFIIGLGFEGKLFITSIILYGLSFLGTFIFYTYTWIKIGKIEITLKERLLYHLFNINKNLEDFIHNRESKKLKRVLKSLDKIVATIEQHGIQIDTGFGYDKPLIESLDMFKYNIPIYKKQIQKANQQKLREHLSFFHSLLTYLNEDEIERFKKLMEKHYKKLKKKKPMLFIFLAKKIPINSFVKYTISIFITLLIIFIFVKVSKINLWNDLSSALGAFVSFCLIVQGIKRIIVDKIERILTDEDKV